MEKISVIVPMYNAGDYIEACLNSVRAQSCPSWELLVIDDGSTDQGPALCRELAAQDSRIRLISQKNQGVSAARNQGLAAAKGEYLFFLDSDDAIHPGLLEALLSQAAERQADIAFCRSAGLNDRELEAALLNSEKTGDLPWSFGEGAKAQEWFHRENLLNGMQQIGGKLVRRAFGEGLAFSSQLTNGEDTLFIYELMRRKPRIAYSPQAWYYYRKRPDSLTHAAGSLENPLRFQALRTIRDREYQEGNQAFALAWERRLAYLLAHSRGQVKAPSEAWKEQAREALAHPLFSRLDRGMRLTLRLACSAYPLLRLVQGAAALRRSLRERLYMEDVDTGILTFHCSDNFGAMLQCWGLKKYLTDHGVRADVVPYEPPFLTGRHWLIPYVPGKRPLGQRLFSIAGGTLAHLAMGRDFFRKRRNMRAFRKTYLVSGRRRRFRFAPGLRRLACRRYVVGSDQIWNPAITCGLRKAYFGAFDSPRKEKVVAYGASFGGSRPDARYDQEFARLLSHVDVVSLRESAGRDYVRQFRPDPVQVLDPVFLLGKEAWQQAEKLPAQKEYVLVFVTEKDPALYDYARSLARETGLRVVELKASKWSAEPDFIEDYAAGPGEFLGYVHQASYVVTNSFHGTAFSILFEKQFIAFLHSSRGERVQNLLQVHGLEDRLYRQEEPNGIHRPVDWARVRARTEEWAGKSKAFLAEHVFL